MENPWITRMGASCQGNLPGDWRTGIFRFPSQKTREKRGEGLKVELMTNGQGFNQSYYVMMPP